MRFIIVIVTAFLLLVLDLGCATKYQWEKPGATASDFYIDSGQCRAQAFSATGEIGMQLMVIFVSCLQGKGWYRVEVRK